VFLGLDIAPPLEPVTVLLDVNPPPYRCVRQEKTVRKFLITFGGVFLFVLILWRLIIRKREEVDWQYVWKPGRLIDLDGETLHYIDEGMGPPVVLVHGFGGHTFSYRFLIPELARHHRVVAVDLLGFGYSERAPGADYSHDAQSRRVLRLMDALGIQRASLVGHSMGGEIVMRVAAAAPERVVRLALVASVSGDRVATLPPTPLIKPLLPTLSRLLGRRMLGASFVDKSKLTEEIWEAYHRPALIRGSMDALYSIMRHSRKDPPIRFDAISAPVLLMFADKERIIPRWMRERLRSRFPRAQVTVIRDAGHLLLEERPGECNAILHRFLDGGAEAPLTGPSAVDTVTRTA